MTVGDVLAFHKPGARARFVIQLDGRRYRCSLSDPGETPAYAPTKAACVFSLLTLGGFELDGRRLDPQFLATLSERSLVKLGNAVFDGLKRRIASGR